MQKISTLETPGLTEIRRNGNTTRQIDFAIQKLFEGFEVLLQDHAKNGEHSESNIKLTKDVQRRISNENWGHQQAGLFLFERKSTNNRYTVYSARASEEGIKNQRIH